MEVVPGSRVPTITVVRASAALLSANSAVFLASLTHLCVSSITALQLSTTTATCTCGLGTSALDVSAPQDSKCVQPGLCERRTIANTSCCGSPGCRTSLGIRMAFSAPAYPLSKPPCMSVRGQSAEMLSATGVKSCQVGSYV